MWGEVTPGQLGSAGSPYDDGVDPWTPGGFNQSAAFTCNIVAAKVVQCVKGAAYSSGVVTGAGQWASGSTFVEYGDTVVGTGRGNSLVGNVGGQPFAFTAGSGYIPGIYTISASNCVTSTGATWLRPYADVTVGSGGSIIDVYGSSQSKAIGFAIGNGCQFNFNSAITASITGSGGSAVLNVTGLSSGGLTSGQTLTGAGVNAGTTLNACTSGCAGNPVVSPLIPTNTTAQTWSLTGYTGTAVSSESMTTALAAMGAGTGGAIAALSIQPTDGVYGIATYNTGATLYGDELYDNSGLVGNPDALVLRQRHGRLFRAGDAGRSVRIVLGGSGQRVKRSRFPNFASRAQATLPTVRSVMRLIRGKAGDAPWQGCLIRRKGARPDLQQRSHLNATAARVYSTRSRLHGHRMEWQLSPRLKGRSIGAFHPGNSFVAPEA